MRGLAERLRRVERQLRTLGDLHVRELGDLGERAGDPGARDALAAIARLHADELRIVLDELDAIAADLADPDDPTDPASSPKRERWLAEEARRADPPPRSRRELLRGREPSPGSADQGVDQDRELGADR